MNNDTRERPVKDNIFQRTWLVLSSPARAFENIAVYPDWIWALLILVVFSIPTTYLIMDYQIADQKAAFMKNKNLNEQQKDAIMQRFEEREAKDETFMDHVKMNGTVILYIFARAFLVAGIFFFIGNFVFGGKANFWQVMGVYCWGYLVAIVELIIKVPLMLAKETTNVYTSLAVLLDPVDPFSWTFKLLNAVDVFDIWRLALWAIGLGVVYKFSKGKAWAVVLSWFIVYVAGKIGLGALTGGIM